MMDAGDFQIVRGVLVRYAELTRQPAARALWAVDRIELELQRAESEIADLREELRIARLDI